MGGRCSPSGTPLTLSSGRSTPWTTAVLSLCCRWLGCSTRSIVGTPPRPMLLLGLIWVLLGGTRARTPGSGSPDLSTGRTTPGLYLEAVWEPVGMLSVKGGLVTDGGKFVVSDSGGRWPGSLAPSGGDRPGCGWSSGCRAGGTWSGSADSLWKSGGRSWRTVTPLPS